MIIQKPDGVIEFGFGRDGWHPGLKVTGMATCGPATEWWRTGSGLGGPFGSWVLCQDARRVERVLAGAADSVAEFLDSMGK